MNFFGVAKAGIRVESVNSNFILLVIGAEAVGATDKTVLGAGGELHTHTRTEIDITNKFIISQKRQILITG